MLSAMKNTVSSGTAAATAKDFYHNILDVFSLDSVAALDLVKDVKNFPSTIRDGRDSDGLKYDPKNLHSLWSTLLIDFHHSVMYTKSRNKR